MRLFQRFGARRGGKQASLGALAGMLDPLRAIFGDPDGRKARLAGERGHKTEPLDASQRLHNYAKQDGGTVRITPARRRRIAKNLRRADEAGAASAWMNWDRSLGQRRREGAEVAG